MESFPAESFEDFFLNLVADRLERQEGLEKHNLAVYILLLYYWKEHLSPQMKSHCGKLDQFKSYSRR